MAPRTRMTLQRVRHVRDRRLSVLIAGALVFFGACEAHTRPTAPEGMLPETVQPARYRLNLTILPDEERFTGHSEIELRLTEPTRDIWLHGKDLIVTSVHVIDAGNRKVQARYQEVDPAGIARISLDREIPAGEARLVFDYNAPLRRVGYSSALHVMEVNGHSYVASLMFSSNARRVFPSFDEPRFKTPYEITIVAPATHVVATNAPLESSEAISDDLKRVRFTPSKPLPTYLVGFAVGPYDVVEGKSIATDLRDREVPVRALGGEGRGEMLRYVVDSTDEILRMLEDYLGTAYPFEKLDLIALPDPAARGGMEDAAIITYGEFELLTDENPPSGHYRDLIYLHAHELAHQWMGDLVTPHWWDDFWINESFATWFGLWVGNHRAQEMGFERLGLRWGLEAMATDTQADAQEIHPRIETIAGMRSGLNQLMYAKGSAVLAMFEHFVGEPGFREGVRTYIRRHEYGTATSADFLDAFEDGILKVGRGKASPHARQLARGSIVSAMSSFIEQPGVPWLNVDWSCADDALKLRVAQRRYVPLGFHSDPNRKWDVPFCFAYEERGERSVHCRLLGEAETEITVPSTSCPSSVMPNADGAGYYRFSMPAPKLTALATRAREMSAAEALSLEDSLSAAMHAGALDVADYLHAVRYFADHPEWDVATAPLPHLDFILDHLVDDEQRQSARAHAGALYAPLLARIGLSGASAADPAQAYEDEQLRERLVPFLAGSVEDAALLEQLREMDPIESRPGPAVMEAALTVQLSRGGTQMADALLRRWRATDDERVRQSMLRAFAAQTDPELSAWVRNLALSEEVAPHAAAELLARHAEEKENLDALWAWQKENLAALVERIRYYWQRDLVLLTGNFCSTTDREDVKRTFEANEALLESGLAVMESALESIDHCVAMKRRHADEVNRFFAGE